MKKIVYVDMDGVLTDFEAGVGRLPDETRLEYAGEYQRVPGIFALLDPMPGAVEAFVELSALFDTYILSTAPWSNPSAWTDKLVWVKEHLGDVARKRLILTHHKYLNLGDYLIDDRLPPQPFRGEFIPFGSSRFPDWGAVMAYLRPRASGG